MDHLLEALLLPEPLARQAWEQWRATVDLDTLSYVGQQLLPALSPAFPEWLESDPDAAIFKGIVRRVWSQNQLLLRRAVDLEAVLRQAGVQPLIAGPLAWSLRVPAPAVRPIPHLTFLVPRADVRKAAGALVQADWELYGDLPSETAWDCCDRICLQQQNLQLHLHWRLLVVPPEGAVECEHAFFSRVSRIQWNHHILRTTSPELTMLHILCGQREGDLPWQADVALAGTADIHWTSFLKLARRFGPLAIERLRELSPFGRLAIPPLASHNPSPLRRKIRYFWNAYRTQSYYQKEALSWPGFARFLALSFARKYAHALPLRLPRK